MDLVCNYKNCSKQITSSGWVTTCSHIFCEEHGPHIKRNRSCFKCPACGSIFKDINSIMESKVNLSNEYKAVALMGIKPCDALEMASNSIRFWMHQLNEELCITRKRCNFYRDKLNILIQSIEDSKQFYEQKIIKLDQQIEAANSTIKKLRANIMEKDKQIKDSSVMDYTQRRLSWSQHNNSNISRFQESFFH